MMVFDKRILDEEVNFVLKYLDQDGNGSVSFQEFENALL
jgi:Ca2+-binding EF-hand superfamily protein